MYEVMLEAMKKECATRASDLLSRAQPVDFSDVLQSSAATTTEELAKTVSLIAAP